MFSPFMCESTRRQIAQQRERRSTDEARPPAGGMTEAGAGAEPEVAARAPHCLPGGAGHTHDAQP